MSFGGMQRVFTGVQEALVLALMLLSIVVIVYADISIAYKVGVAVIVFAVIFLTTLATQYLKEQKQARQQQARAM